MLYLFNVFFLLFWCLLDVFFFIYLFRINTITPTTNTTDAVVSISNEPSSLTNSGAAKLDDIMNNKKKLNEDIDELIKDNLLKEELIINEIKTTASSRSTSTGTTTILPTTKVIPILDIDLIIEQQQQQQPVTQTTPASSIPIRLKHQNGSASKFLLNDSNSFNNTDLLSTSSSSSLATATNNAYLNGHGPGSTSGISSSYVSDMSGVDLSMDSVVDRFNEEY
jgi:hypothetical protein